MKNNMKIFAAFGTVVMVFAFIAGINARPSAAQTGAGDTLWSVRCNEDGDKSCEIFQRLVVQETGQRVVEFAIGYPEDKKDVARGVMVMPLGILLQSGAIMQIDDNPPFKFDVRFCVQAGCFAYLNLNTAILDKMRKGGSAKVSFKSLDGKDMSVDLSLKGFTKALADIS